MQGEYFLSPSKDDGIDLVRMTDGGSPKSVATFYGSLQDALAGAFVLTNAGYISVFRPPEATPEAAGRHPAAPRG